jgi:hypothetical protein
VRRLFAFDLAGFGASERGEDLLSPRAIGELLARLIAEADLDTPHLVAPDVENHGRPLGGGRPSRADRQRDRGQRRTAVRVQLGEPLASWVLDPDLDKYRKMDPRVIVGAAQDTP